MIQKKICMVGVFGTGKTCLVQRFVHSIFSTRYHSTVGVKIDRKTVTVDGSDVSLVLWDLAGRDGQQEIGLSYLRGAHGTIYVVDGTRRDTYEEIFEIAALVRGVAGDIPGVVALNKTDLVDEWQLSAEDEKRLADRAWHAVRTSAKSGAGVEAVFQWIAAAAAQHPSRAP